MLHHLGRDGGDVWQVFKKAEHRFAQASSPFWNIPKEKREISSTQKTCAQIQQLLFIMARVEPLQVHQLVNG